MSDEALLDFAEALKRAQKRLDGLMGGKTPLVVVRTAAQRVRGKLAFPHPDLAHAAR